MRRLLLALLLFVPAAPALAHKASDAYLTLERDGTALRGQWDIALRDLDNALDLDANGDGDITWGEVRARASDIAAYALHRLQISSGGERCALASTGQRPAHLRPGRRERERLARRHLPGGRRPVVGPGLHQRALRMHRRAAGLGKRGSRPARRERHGQDREQRGRAAHYPATPKCSSIIGTTSRSDHCSRESAGGPVPHQISEPSESLACSAPCEPPPTWCAPPQSRNS